MRRKVEGLIQGKVTRDGAGVKLYRVFGGLETVDITDPFLLLDFFGSDKPEEYIMGFPWHPHRGIETVTLLYKGKVEHEDSEGNKGVIYPGQAQWMTAGSGIFHQEMPKPMDRTFNYPYDPNTVSGLQLWINLPANLKMTDPVYKDVKQIPKEEFDFGTIQVLSGEYKGLVGLVRVKSPVDPSYYDVELHGEFNASFKHGYTVLAFVVEGKVTAEESLPSIPSGNLIVFSREGEEIKLSGEGRVIILAGRPLYEPVAWYGPIVMNTREQIYEALDDLRKGTFVKKTGLREDV
ncbi:MULTISPECIES: pirin family protein [unclassified Stygiolobus]|uniref:pirin family protein n=1 Tax=unclassified Stygiolobus TaxID=2824672 RepID=UPI00307ED212